jgi:hypothetical protein
MAALVKKPWSPRAVAKKFLIQPPNALRFKGGWLTLRMSGGRRPQAEVNWQAPLASRPLDALVRRRCAMHCVHVYKKLEAQSGQVHRREQA